MTDYEFTPIKSAKRSLEGEVDFWVSPGPMEIAGVEESQLLTDIGVKQSWSLGGQGGLKVLVEAAQEIAVKKNVTLPHEVPIGLEFLLQEPQSAEEAYAQIVQLLEAAQIAEVEQMGFPKRGGRNRQTRAWFMRSLAARAVDVAVVKKTGTSGLVNEHAGAVITAGYQAAKPVAEHVTAFLKAQNEWVFGDYAGQLSNTNMRLLQSCKDSCTD